MIFHVNKKPQVPASQWFRISWLLGHLIAQVFARDLYHDSFNLQANLYSKSNDNQLLVIDRVICFMTSRSNLMGMA